MALENNSGIIVLLAIKSSSGVSIMISWIWSDSTWAIASLQLLAAAPEASIAMLPLGSSFKLRSDNFESRSSFRSSSKSSSSGSPQSESTPQSNENAGCWTLSFDSENGKVGDLVSF